MDLTALGARCAAVVAENGPLFGALFLAGLVGSASHCMGMCGPFVLAQCGARLNRVSARGSDLSRLVGAFLLPYHLGRATTYVGLGAVLAAPFGLLTALGGMNRLPALMLLAASLVFLTQAVQGFRGSGGGDGVHQMGAGRSWLDPAANRLSLVLRPFFAAPFGWRGYLLGVGLGFLPCGLLYGALAAAAATADPLAAGLGMAGFVLGTMPMLFATGYLGQRAAAKWRHLANGLFPFVAGFNALVLMLMAYRLFDQA